jgi:hypothetical protein
LVIDSSFKFHVSCQNRKYFNTKWKLRCALDILIRGMVNLIYQTVKKNTIQLFQLISY